MAKKTNKQHANLIHSVAPSSHAYLRVNFLYQAAVLLNEQKSTQSSDNGLAKVARFYVETMREVMRKGQVRLHPHTKRTICGECHRVFSDGTDGGFRVTLPRKRPLRMRLVCSGCGASKAFRRRRDHLLAVERQEQQQQLNSSHR